MERINNSVLYERPEPREKVASAGEYRKFAMRKLRRRVRIITQSPDETTRPHVRTRDMCAEPSIDRTVHAATTAVCEFPMFVVVIIVFSFTATGGESLLLHLYSRELPLRSIRSAKTSKQSCDMIIILHRYYDNTVHRAQSWV